MEVSDKLTELKALVESARAMPMSASCIVNRAEVMAAIEDIERALPDDLRSAQRLLVDRSAVVDQGRVEAQRLIDAAAAERERMLSKTEVVQAATREADRLVAAATEDAERMRRELDDYIDGKLANFEIVLHKTLAAVERGREKISGRTQELEALSDSTEIAEPLPG